MKKNSIYLIIGASSEVGMQYIGYLDEKSKKEESTIVIAHCRNQSEKLEELKCKVKNIQVEYLQADLEEAEQLELMLEQIEDKFGTPSHILHLAAPALEFMKIKQFDWEKIERNMQIQVRTLGLIFSRFLPQMAKQKFGKVVIMLSAVTLGAPPKYMTGYVIGKYALLGLLKSASIEYAGKGIAINGISPNMMETKFLDKIDSRVPELAAMNSSMKRNIRVEEVLPAISFLMSEGSDYMTGANINLTGGDF